MIARFVRWIVRKVGVSRLIRWLEKEGHSDRAQRDELRAFLTAALKSLMEGEAKDPTKPEIRRASLPKLKTPTAAHTGLRRPRNPRPGKKRR